MTMMAILIKLLLYVTLVDGDQIRMYTVFGHLLIILSGTYFGIRNHKMAIRNSSVKDDILAGMRIAGIYALLVTVTVLIHFSLIEPDYLSKAIEERMLIASEYKETHPEYDIENTRQGLEFTFNLKIYAAFTTFALLMAGTVYSIILSLLVKKMNIWKV